MYIDAPPCVPSPSSSRSLIAVFSQELLCSCHAGGTVGGGKQHQQELELGGVTQTAAALGGSETDSWCVFDV